ncbi:MAG: hypothetical protein AAGC76_09405 [Luteibacter sp.]|uniref:hypothetical protein n=1 Tax=Luteibacter sp. TaxID=1886636 RepID=UPI0028067AD5|nr:hypothetical protein [Luteibacter sp.]MDQ7996058.1 hypothetical protein [Luteibacter sp.]
MNDLATLPDSPTLEQIHQLEAFLLTQPRDDCATSHYFADGVYGRALLIPAGTALTGKMHRQRHLNFLMQGTIRVWTEQGGMKELEAPQIIVSDPGTKRVGYALTDTIWVTVHATEKTDLAEIEAEVIIPETSGALPGEAS